MAGIYVYADYEDGSPDGEWFVKIVIPAQPDWKDTEKIAGIIEKQVKEKILSRSDF